MLSIYLTSVFSSIFQSHKNMKLNSLKTQYNLIEDTSVRKLMYKIYKKNIQHSDTMINEQFNDKIFINGQLKDVQVFVSGTKDQNILEKKLLFPEYASNIWKNFEVVIQITFNNQIVHSTKKNIAISALE